MSDASRIVKRTTLGLGVKDLEALEYLVGIWKINGNDSVNRAIRLAAKLMSKTLVEGSEQPADEIEIIDGKGRNVTIWIV